MDVFILKEITKIAGDGYILFSFHLKYIELKNTFTSNIFTSKNG